MLPSVKIPLWFKKRRSCMTLSRNGFVFFAMLMALLFGSINHNNNLGFILTFLLGGMACVSLVHTLRNLTGLTLTATRSEPVFAGQQAAFDILVEAGNQSRPSLSFAFPGSPATSTGIPADSPKTVTVLHDTHKRGLLTPGSVDITTTYPLGLFQIRTSFAIKGSCLVYPRPVPGPLITAPAPGDDDNQGESAGSGVDDFDGLDTYQPGDPLRRVSWKAYSRGQGMQTKKFAGQQGRTMLFNPEALPGHDLEQKLSRICHMILRADALHLTYGLQLGSKIITPGGGGSHKHQCLRELALANA